MSYLTKIFTVLKNAWPIVSFVIGALSMAHANASRIEAKSGEVSVESQAVHVGGAGIVGSVGLLAGVCGMGSTISRLKAAPSVPPVGVDPVLHQESILHAALIVSADTTKAELDKLNELIQIRKKTA